MLTLKLKYDNSMLFDRTSNTDLCIKHVVRVIFRLSIDKIQSFSFYNKNAYINN